MVRASTSISAARSPAAIFDDPAKVTFVPLSASERFEALRAGRVDLLSRNSTWTLEREAGLGLAFAGITYHDGQGFMVMRELNVTSALELDQRQGLRRDRHDEPAQPRRLLPRQLDDLRGARLSEQRRGPRAPSSPASATS